CFANQALGEHRRLLVEEAAVQKRERLGGGGGRAPPWAGFRVVSAVENFKLGKRQRSLHVDIKAAPTRCAVVGLAPSAAGPGLTCQYDGVDRRGDAGTAKLEVQSPRCRQDRVTDRLGFEPSRAHPPEQRVGRVGFGGRLVPFTRLS